MILALALCSTSWVATPPQSPSQVVARLAGQNPEEAIELLVKMEPEKTLHLLVQCVQEQSGEYAWQAGLALRRTWGLRLPSVAWEAARREN